jgi:hypothetical protein
MPNLDLQPRRAEVLDAVLRHVDSGDALAVLEAPPGSGKTHVSLRAVVLGHIREQRMAVVTQTGAQADDFCRRLSREFPGVPAIRFAPSGSELDDAPSTTLVHAAKDLPLGPSIVIATAAKWGVHQDLPEFDTMVVDEAWQMTWATLMQLDHVAPRFVFIGDPGQIEPTVTIDTSRWETSRRPPHHSAPEIVLRDPTLPVRVFQLPVSTRLPFDTVELVRGFYDFHFDSWAREGERALLTKATGARCGVDAAIDRLRGASLAALTLPTPDHGPPDSDDPEIAEAAAGVVRRLLSRRVRARTEDGVATVAANDIGVVATHRVMVGRIVEALGDLADEVRVDTPERWQGLERTLMVGVHPLSSVNQPSAFDLNTGRLCVMTSRHRVGCILVTRDHVGSTLATHLPGAEQAVGRPDAAGRGHAQHQVAWRWLEDRGLVVSM